MRILGQSLALGLALLVSGCGASGAEKAFGAFQKSMRNGNCPELRALVAPESAAAAWVEQYCTPPAA